MRGWRSVVAAALVLGCENVQDLGAHASSGAGPSGFPSLPDGGGLPVEVEAGRAGASKVFFVTDNIYSGDLATEGGASSGLVGADNVCNKEARTAGLAGTFKAWLSTSDENAKDRIAAVGPWRMIDDDRDIFANASVDAPRHFPSRGPTGTDLFFVNDPEVWTGTNARGTLNANGLTCAGWTSKSASDRGSRGELNSFSDPWTDNASFGTSETSPCSSRHRLYCFEQ